MRDIESSFAEQKRLLANMTAEQLEELIAEELEWLRVAVEKARQGSDTPRR